MSPGHAGVGLLERTEEPLQILLRDAAAGVFHGELQLARGFVIAHPQADLALESELHRVRQQVRQHLPQAGRIGHHGPRHVRGDLGADRDPLPGRRRGLFGDQFAGQRDELHGNPLREELAGFDLGQIEDLIDEPQQVLAVSPDRAAVFRQVRVAVPRPGPAVPGGSRGEIGVPQDRRQRGTQFVAHIRQELAFRTIRSLRGDLGVSQFRFHAHPLRDVDGRAMEQPRIAVLAPDDSSTGGDPSQPIVADRNPHVGLKRLIFVAEPARVPGVDERFFECGPQGVAIVRVDGRVELRRLNPGLRGARRQPPDSFQPDADANAILLQIPNPGAGVGGGLGQFLLQPRLGRGAIGSCRGGGQLQQLRSRPQKADRRAHGDCRRRGFPQTRKTVDRLPEDHRLDQMSEPAHQDEQREGGGQLGKGDRVREALARRALRLFGPPEHHAQQTERDRQVGEKNQPVADDMQPAERFGPTPAVPAGRKVGGVEQLPEERGGALGSQFPAVFRDGGAGRAGRRGHGRRNRREIHGPRWRADPTIGPRCRALSNSLRSRTRTAPTIAASSAPIAGTALRPSGLSR
ncbi:hypothetical protein LzC2_37690 [Planctomycetes bacterium LzC2]|uniref:Uncharacterized protein n=1 Tax=Alienimonas chondri TaxID=2681879 RepID=A0ABX1VMD1_9PLAN|nr:hypothetical protein [Alienimonas chondri]